MTKEFDREAIDRLARIKITSSLFDKEPLKIFNSPKYRFIEIECLFAISIKSKIDVYGYHFCGVE